MIVKPGSKVCLKEYDPDDTGRYEGDNEAKEELAKHLDQLARLQNLLYAENRRALLIILQGMDTSGKDGTIRHVMAGLSPQGVQVRSFKKPTEEELAHDFLWRIHRCVPRRGEIGIFNRSHYEDVLVVRVHELVPKNLWRERYEQINQFEKILVRNGAILLKFFLHISKKEQKERLQERLADPTRYWKFSIEDVAERKYWSEYRRAYEAALSRCSTRWAPWHIVPANHKWYRNLAIARTIIETLQQLDMQYPPPSVDIDQVKVH